MRRVIPLLPLLLLGCGLLRFEIEEEASTEVQGAGLLGELLQTLSFTGLDDFDATVEQEIADQGVEPGDVRSLVLTRLALSAEPDLSFIDTMEIYVSAPGVDEVRVAHGADFPPGQAEVELELDEVDLVEALVAGAMTFRVEVDGTAPVEDTQVTLDIAAEVEASAKGACRATQD